MTEAKTTRAIEDETIHTTLWCDSCERGWDDLEANGHLVQYSAYGLVSFLCQECFNNDTAHRHAHLPNVTVAACIGHLAVRP